MAPEVVAALVIGVAMVLSAAVSATRGEREAKADHQPTRRSCAICFHASDTPGPRARAAAISTRAHEGRSNAIEAALIIVGVVVAVLFAYERVRS